MITCQVCGTETLYLPDHLQAEHGLSVTEYRKEHPDSPIASPEVIERLRHTEHGGLTNGLRKHPPPAENLTARFAGVRFPVNGDVPPEVCLDLPEKYRIPTVGPLANDIAELAVVMLGDEPIWVHGQPGTGKDAAFFAWSYYTRTPALFLQINAQTNIKAWFYRRGFDKDGTNYEEGKVLKALRDGYTTPDGRVVPYLILLSDADRADPRQLEAFRSIIESSGGRVEGPMGEFYPVVPGSKIAFTANSAGGGDEFGRCITSNALDSSFLDRTVALKFHWLEWEDEVEILKEKFEVFCDRIGDDNLAKIGKVTQTMREKIEAEEIDAEFSHRALEHWCAHGQRILQVIPGSGLPKNILLRAARVGFLDKQKDRTIREQMWTVLTTHIPEEK